MRKGGKNILRRIFLGLLACLMLPDCAGEEDEMQETLPREEGGCFPERSGILAG